MFVQFQFWKKRETLSELWALIIYDHEERKRESGREKANQSDFIARTAIAVNSTTAMGLLVLSDQKFWSRMHRIPNWQWPKRALLFPAVRQRERTNLARGMDRCKVRVHVQTL